MSGRRLNGNLPWRLQRGLAPDHGHLVLAHQEADTVVQPLGHRARARHHRLGVKGDVLGRKAIVLGVLHGVKDFGRTQQRLGRDAAPVETDAAEIGTLDDRGSKAELRRADRGHIAARSGADNDDIEGGVSHARARISLMDFLSRAEGTLANWPARANRAVALTAAARRSWPT